LEAKLADYCMKFDGLKDFFQTTGKERREFERQKATGKIALIILDRYGKDTGITSKGDLVDISNGGIAFLVHMSQKRNARLLLGRNVSIVFSVETPESEKPFKVAGLVVAVSPHKSKPNEYFVHIRFDDPIRTEDMQEIVGAAKQEH
jgi:c-di-GMP-binding flagellar brake protein YcgR